jgi:acetoin utilization deacetylase AcuC-like enzyme
MNTLEIRTHPDCLAHQPGLGHPEHPGRIEAVMNAVDAGDGKPWVVLPRAEPAKESATFGALKWIHDEGYLERVRSAVAAAPGHVDTPDCAVSPGTWTALMAASGIALQAALDVANQKLRRAFLAIRPPSHHAETERARGYCLVNATALVAEVLARTSVAPVLIVDFDAHHGNGTQEMFWERSDVALISVHEWPAFPGTGAGDEIGSGKGRGFTRNVPLTAGADDAVVATAVEHALEEMVARVRPASVVVSAGFNGHAADPVANWSLTSDGFRRITRALVQAADACSGGRIVSVLEGGYDGPALGDSVRQHVTELAAGEPVN